MSLGAATSRVGGFDVEHPVPVMQDVKLLVGLVMILGALVDLPRSLGVGSFSALGFITAFLILLALITWLSSGLIVPRVGVIAGFFLLFLAWGSVSFVWFPPTMPGVQNLLVVLAFTVLIVAVSDRALLAPGLPWYVGRMLAASSGAAAAVYAASVLVDGPGAGSILSSRAFSLFAMSGVAWSLAAWRYRSPRWLWAAAILTGLIVISLSRLATVTALLMFPLAWFSPRNLKAWVRTGLVVGLVGGLFLLAAVRFQPLHQRFFEAGPSGQRHGSPFGSLPGSARERVLPAS
jgi:hypothetical protein